MEPIAFLGAGNMAGALIDGLISQGAGRPADFLCLGGSGGSARALAARTGVRLAGSLDELLFTAGILVVAFKPQHLAQADPRLATLTAGKLVVSVLAGKRLTALEQVFPAARNWVRCMPNTPGQIGAGITAWCASRPLEGADRRSVETLLEALGRALELPEAQLDAVTALSGSGPAYVFEFAAALRDAGVAAGLDSETARILTVETLLGSAQLLARRNLAPEALRDQVTSPNGTTAAGLKKFAEAGFRGTLRAAVLAAKARSEELSRS